MTQPVIYNSIHTPSLNLLDVTAVITNGTTDNLIIAAVANKKIRVIGMVIHSTGAVTQTSFRSGAGGTAKFYVSTTANTAADSLVLPPNPYGYFDTDTGVGLYANGGAVTAVVSIRYILIDPQT